jgi:hypothetical protein
MAEFLVPFGLGILCIVIGISNMRGNISMLHSYHRKRVAEEDRLPMGRKVGIGTIIVGVTVMLYSVLTVLPAYESSRALQIVSDAVMAVGLAAGLGICGWAIIKYNKGLF